MKTHHAHKQAGFTLLEMLLSATVIGMLVLAGLPVYESFVRRNDLDLTTQSVVSSLRRAQTYARGSHGDSAWSVRVVSGTATLFKGTNYATRDASLDETISLPGTISTSGLSEIQFASFSSAPNTTGSIILTSNTNDSRTISINAKGMVSY